MTALEADDEPQPRPHVPAVRVTDESASPSATAPTSERVLVATLFLPTSVSVSVSASAETADDDSDTAAPSAIVLGASSRGNGGLFNAINAAMREGNAPDCVFVGCFPPASVTSTANSNCGTRSNSTPPGSVAMPSRQPPPPPSPLLLSDEDQLRVSDLALSLNPPCVPVFLSDDDIDGHYNMFCKQVLWKPFHYQLQDYPKGHAFEERAWVHYQNVNRLFAEKIVSIHRENDIIWVNDYHLMLVPEMIRRAIPSAKIGFFLHIPFPSSEIFRCLHARKQILEGMLGADLVGFQTYSYLRHFLMTCTRLLSLDSTPRGIQLKDKAVNVGIFPIGIDLATLNAKRSDPDVLEMIEALEEKYSGKLVLIGRDKNDYVKGVRQKMLAYEAFLQQHAEFRGRVVLIQVALSTTEENEHESQVNEIVARINSTFGSIEYTPVVFLQQNISFSNYLALLSIADVCVITSLRDGMNLTSHEYVVCQERKMSPLIISEFAGTYSSLGAGLRVNPWDTQEVADAIFEALTMTQDEKTLRWKEMYNYVSTHTAQNYFQKFVSETSKVHNELERLETSHIPRLSRDVVIDAYKNSHKRIFFLDHDGTITNSVINSTEDFSDENVIRETEASVIDLVYKLASKPHTLVYIMSGRRRRDLEQFIGTPNVGICAENGCFLMHANSTKWHAMLTDLDLSWRKEIVDIFEYYTDRTPGSMIQQNDVSIIWHFGRADSSFGKWQALECQNHIQNHLGTTYPITILAKQSTLEIFPRNVNKGRTVRRVLEHHYGNRIAKRLSYPPAPIHQRSHGSHGHQLSSSASPTGSRSKKFESSSPSHHHHHHGHHHQDNSGGVFDFVFCIGDDRADEFMFEYVHSLDPTTPQQHAAAPSPEASPAQDRARSPSIPPAGDSRKLLSLQEVYHARDVADHAPKRNIFSVTVGKKSSSAKWYVSDVDDVIGILASLI
ncbi:hypothetical protein HDU82_004062 [Entophlyctis luteolus]|nr:hypothetical protein HDU82_004062 [Entophlyctis luteolus]